MLLVMSKKIRAIQRTHPHNQSGFATPLGGLEKSCCFFPVYFFPSNAKFSRVTVFDIAFHTQCVSRSRLYRGTTKRVRDLEQVYFHTVPHRFLFPFSFRYSTELIQWSERWSWFPISGILARVEFCARVEFIVLLAVKARQKHATLQQNRAHWFALYERTYFCDMQLHVAWCRKVANFPATSVNMFPSIVFTFWDSHVTCHMFWSIDASCQRVFNYITLVPQGEQWKNSTRAQNSTMVISFNQPKPLSPNSTPQSIQYTIVSWRPCSVPLRDTFSGRSETLYGNFLFQLIIYTFLYFLVPEV